MSLRPILLILSILTLAGCHLIPHQEVAGPSTLDRLATMERQQGNLRADFNALFAQSLTFVHRSEFEGRLAEQDRGTGVAIGASIEAMRAAHGAEAALVDIPIVVPSDPAPSPSMGMMETPTPTPGQIMPAPIPIPAPASPSDAQYRYGFYNNTTTVIGTMVISLGTWLLARKKYKPKV